MQRVVCGIAAFGLCFLLVGAARSDDQADARAIVGKSIKAVGGEEKLAKTVAQTFKEAGTYYGMGDGLPYVGNYAVQYPRQFRMEIEGVFTMVVNGDKGWIQAGGETNEMTSDQLKAQHDELYAGWISRLVPLSDKKFKLATIGEIKVNERPAVGVRVSCEGHRDVNLYFDKDSALLVKTEHRAISTEQGGKEVNQETYISDFREIAGTKIPHKFLITRDGEKFVEAEASDLQSVGKLDDSTFGRP
jgi:hypothetical protein